MYLNFIKKINLTIKLKNGYKIENKTNIIFIIFANLNLKQQLPNLKKHFKYNKTQNRNCKFALNSQKFVKESLQLIFMFKIGNYN